LAGAASAVLISPQAFATATPFSLTFQGLQNSEPIVDYYDGGLGGFGSGPGPNYGVIFTSNSLAENISSPPFPPPVPPGNPVAFFTGTGDYMNVPGGFDTSLSFYYFGTSSGSVTVFSGLNGTGNSLLTLTLPPDSIFSPAGGFFSGTAESVDFSGSANNIYFDNITSAGSLVVPEPATLTVFGAGVLWMTAWARRSRRRASK
jgi:hypothetical protein